MTATESETYNIKEASEATGLTPSVLRIWELRYGWPTPCRRSNGYRTYQRHQIEDLRKIASLVHGGMSISSIIVDGSPRWPMPDLEMSAPRLLKRARALPVPAETRAATLNRDLMQAFATLNPRAVMDLLQRIFWTVTPREEPCAALVPALVALAELREGKRPMPEAEAIAGCVQDRCIQIMRMNHSGSGALSVVPVRASDGALAHLSAVILGQRGVPARPWLQTQEPSMPYLLAGVGETVRRKKHVVGVVSALGWQDSVSLAQLLDPSLALPWTLPAMR